jgi:hypothetical protein
MLFLSLVPLILGSLNTGAHPREGCRAAGHPKPQNRFFKNTDFVDIIMSNVLRDVPFSRNQPLKSVDDWYIRILKN